MADENESKAPKMVIAKHPDRGEVAISEEAFTSLYAPAGFEKVRDLKEEEVTASGAGRNFAAEPTVYPDNPDSVAATQDVSIEDVIVADSEPDFQATLPTSTKAKRGRSAS